MKSYSIVISVVVILLSQFSFAQASFAQAGVGEIEYGTLCVYGNISEPIKVGLELKTNEPQISESLKLDAPLGPIYFYADCKKKKIEIQAPNPSIFISHETMPDGSFSLSLPALHAAFSQNESSCHTSVTPQVWGRISCEDRDEPVIEIETVLWLDRDLGSYPGQCSFPKGTYLYSQLSLQQCH